MNFGILCDFFDNVRHTKGTSEKTKLTKTFISALRDQQQDLFPVLRLIIPKLDRDRPSYRIKESKISKLLIKMLGLPHGNDQNVLLKAITGTSSGVDFGDVVYSVLKKIRHQQRRRPDHSKYKYVFGPDSAQEDRQRVRRPRFEHFPKAVPKKHKMVNPDHLERLETGHQRQPRLELLPR
jgi:hypothetical protein